jgi:hypothetical protein
MRSRIPELVAATRTDLSQWLWHFTRRDQNPIETLTTIVKSKSLLGSMDRFSDNPFVCFSEAPLAQLLLQSPILAANGYHRLSNFGVGVRKSWLYKRGGLPVIYQPDSLISELCPNQRFRHVTLDLDRGLDYTWQREWRIPTDRLALDQKETIVVAPEMGEFEGTIYEIGFDDILEHEGMQSHPTLIQYWSCIDLDYIKDFASINDELIQVFLRKDSI